MEQAGLRRWAPDLPFFFLLLLLSSLELSDTKVYEPEVRARLGTARLTILHDGLTETLPCESVFRIRALGFRFSSTRFADPGENGLSRTGVLRYSQGTVSYRRLSLDGSLISQIVFVKLFCRSRFPHKSIHLSFIIAVKSFCNSQFPHKSVHLSLIIAMKSFCKSRFPRKSINLSLIIMKSDSTPFSPGSRVGSPANGLSPLRSPGGGGAATSWSTEKKVCSCTLCTPPQKHILEFEVWS